jgi:ElaB/YqjD/DUF883 family membrane-anchored ribosome-binding protein
MLPRKREENSDIPQYMKSIKKDVDTRLTKIKSEMDEVQKIAAKTMKEQPLLALGVAFVVGMAIGIALASAGD